MKIFDSLEADAEAIAMRTIMAVRDEVEEYGRDIDPAAPSGRTSCCRWTRCWRPT